MEWLDHGRVGFSLHFIFPITTVMWGRRGWSWVTGLRLPKRTSWLSGDLRVGLFNTRAFFFLNAHIRYECKNHLSWGRSSNSFLVMIIQGCKLIWGKLKPEPWLASCAFNWILICRCWQIPEEQPRWYAASKTTRSLMVLFKSYCGFCHPGCILSGAWSSNLGAVSCLPTDVPATLVGQNRLCLEKAYA